jgi:hypothetical protein
VPRELSLPEHTHPTRVSCQAATGFGCSGRCGQAALSSQSWLLPGTTTGGRGACWRGCAARRCGGHRRLGVCRSVRTRSARCAPPCHHGFLLSCGARWDDHAHRSDMCPAVFGSVIFDCIAAPRAVGSDWHRGPVQLRPCTLPTVRRRVGEHPHSVSVIGSPNHSVIGSAQRSSLFTVPPQSGRGPWSGVSRAGVSPEALRVSTMP